MITKRGEILRPNCPASNTKARSDTAPKSIGSRRLHPMSLSVLCSSSHLAGGHSLGDQALESQLLLLEVLRGGVLNLQLGHSVAKSRFDLLLVATLQLHGHSRVRDDLLDARDVRLELLARLELLGESLVAGLELCGVCTKRNSELASDRGNDNCSELTLNHLLNLGARELADSVGDGDVGTATRGLLGGGNLQDTVDVDLENTLQGSLTGTHRRNRSKSELAKGSVVGTVGTLTLVNGELDGSLVVDNGGEGALLDGRDSLATGNDGGKDVTLHGDTEGERNNVEKQKVLGLGGSGLAGENTGLDSGTVSNSLIRVNAL